MIQPAQRGPRAGALPIDCPSCRAAGAVRWDRLGRLHTCRRCGRSFRVDPCGGAVEVVQTKGARWVDRTASAAARRRRTARRLGFAALPVLGFLTVAVLIIRLTARPPAASAAELPSELQPRAEVFTRAWLGKDWSVLRRLARPGEERDLYRWSVHNPPPAGGEAAVEVTILATQGTTATVRIRARGVPDQVQLWEERGGAWYFLVPARPRKH